MDHSVRSANLFFDPVKSDSLATALQLAGVGVWDLDLVYGKTLSFDEQSKTILGLKEGNELEYEAIISAIHEADRDTFLQAINDAKNGSGGGKFEISYRLKGIHDDVIRTVRSAGTFRFGDDGAATGASGISMHTRVEHELENEILKLRSVINTSPDLMGTFDSDGAIEFLNDAGMKTYGLTENDANGNVKPQDFYTEDSRLDELDASLEQQGEWGGKVYLRHSQTGEIIPAWGEYKQITDPATGEVLGKTASMRDLRPQYAAEKAFRDSENHWKSIIEQSPVGIAFLKGKDLIVTSANEKMLGIWNRTADIEGKPFPEVLPQIAATQYLDILRNVFATGEAYYGYAIQVINPALADRLFDIVYKPLYNHHDVIEGIIVLATDVTEQMKNESDLAETELRYRTLLEHAPFATAIYLGEEMVIEMANAPMFELWGKSNEVLGQRLADAIPELVGQQFLDLLANVYKSGVAHVAVEEPGELIINGRRSKFYFNYTYKPLFDGNGKVYGIMNMAVDVTEQVMNRLALEKSQMELLTYFEQSPVAIATISKENHVFELANPFYAELVGRTVDQIVGKPLLEALPEIAGQGFDKLIDEVISTGIPYVADQVPVQLIRNGALTTRFVNLHYHPKRNARNEIVGILVVATDVTEVTNALNELRISETKLKGIISSAPAGIGLFVGRDLIIENPNQTFIDIVGKGPGVEGLPLREAMPELVTEGQPFLQILDDVFTTGEMFQSFGSLVKIVQNGVMTNNYYNITYSPVFNEKGEVYAILDIAIDVTEQMKAQQLLQERERFIRSVFEDSPVAKMVFTGPDMTIKDVNKSMLGIFGRESAEGFIGLQLYEASPELQSMDFQLKYDKVVKTGTTHYEYAERIVLMKSGEPYTGYYDYIFKPLRGAGDEIYGVICTMIEVTEQVLARTKIKEAETRLIGAIEVAGLATWSYDLRSQTFAYSERFMRWAGFSHNVSDMDVAFSPLPDEYRDVVARDMRDAILKTGHYDQVLPIVNTQTGERKIIHSQGQVFYDELGAPIMMHGTARDITMEQELQLELSRQVQERTEELAAANEELTSSNEHLAMMIDQLSISNDELSQYAYVASHDLQEPLRKIRMFSSMLKAKDNLPSDQQVIIEKIDKSSERMSLLINDLLEFSRTNKVTKGTVAVNLNEIVKAVLVDFELLIEEKNAMVSVAKLPLVKGVALQMNQLFYNLLSNALKFSVPGRQLQIAIAANTISADEIADKYPGFKLMQDAEYCDITISDNGIGFSGEYAEQIFEVFKRLHEKSIYPGSGIGLALCRKIVNHHNGYIYADSVKGEGTTFHIVMPVLTEK